MGLVVFKGITYLLSDLAAQLCAICFVGRVRVDGDDEVGELPIDERAQ